MDLLWFIGMFAGGLVLLLLGGKALVDASVALATRLGVAPLLVGLTIVAWGTSAPELALNTISAAKGRTDLAFGNLVGANICNLGLIVGVCALFKPLVVSDSVIRRELPIMAIALVVMLALGLFGGAGFARWEGILLLAIFAVYSGFTIVSGLRAKPHATPLDEQVKHKHHENITPRSLASCAVGFVGGLTMLGVGGMLAADGASGAAAALGVSPTIIGLTVVAIGTTLPELVTGVIAVRKGHVDLAMGNVVGSCMANAACIFGLAVTISPMDMPTNGLVALGVMTGLGILLLPMSRTFRGTISRLEGIALLAIYAAFLGFQVYAVLAAPDASLPAGGQAAP